MKYFWIISALLTVTSAVSSQQIGYNEIEQNIQRYQQKIINLKSTLDKSIFDDEEIIIKYEFDAEKISAFVQEKFTFQPYVGLLRGVHGTLNSRSGNALDQSVLLVKLLGDAGFETRIVNGQLTDKEALDLVLSLGNAKLPSAIGNGDDYHKALAKFTHNKPQQINWKNTQTFKRYAQSKSNLEQLLQANNIKFEEKDLTAKLVQQSKDYFWVQFRMGESQEWQNTHPAMKKGTNLKVKPLAYIKDTIPEKYLHQLKVESFIQQRIGDKLTTHSLMKPWIRPVANLNNMTLTYTNMPSAAKIGNSFDEVVSNSHYFTPTLNGNSIGDKVFDMKGRIIDAFAMQQDNLGQGALFQTVGNKLEAAIGGVDGKDKSETLMQLTAQWLQFTFIAPDGLEFVQKRYLYETDNFKVTKLSNKKAKLALMGEYHLLASSGQQPLAYLAHTYINLIEDSMPLLKTSAKKVYNPDEKTTISKKDLTIKSNFELLVQNRLMENQPDKNKSIIKYNAHANLIGIKRGYVDAATAFIAVDIISNRKNHLIKKDNKIFASTQSAFATGIWETASEWLPSRFLNLKQESLDTLQIQSAALKQNIAMKILKKDDLKTVNIKNKNILARIKKEMEQGYTIIIPENKPDDFEMTGWWRVNLSTGETLGMTADGGGQSTVEYLTQVTQNALFVVRALDNLKKCNGLTNDVAKLCCLTEAHFNNVAGLSFGSILGASVGTAASAVFDIADYIIEAKTGKGLTPNTNGALCKDLNPPPNL